MRLFVLVAVAGSLLTLAPAFGATTPPASKDACFLTQYLRGHTVAPDGHTVYFDLDGRATYRLTTSGACLAHATASDTLLLRDRGQGWICRPLDLELSVRGVHCIVDTLTKLTPLEAAALPKRLQP